MSKFPFILTLVLIGAWAYTSWNWYVCNIKGLCDKNISRTQNSDENSNILSYDDVTWHNVLTGSEDTQSWSVLNGTWELYDSPKLSAGDVLIENPRPKKEEVEIKDDKIEVQENLSWSTNEWNTDNNIEADITITVGNDKNDICKTPLIWPISYGGANKKSEVELLEAFLISRGASLQVNGVYGQDDFDEMKKFQLEYKSEVLEPWGIENPTWYVGKTTIKKINELACQ